MHREEGGIVLRFKSEKELSQQSESGQMSQAVIRQLRAALQADVDQSVPGQKAPKPKSQGRANVPGESKGEASVRLALTAAFGSWERGGEVLAECRPFQTRQFRADFTLPRWRISAEIDGWRHHGRSLSDHHSDRERAIFFASHDWLVFPVSHAQALKETPLLVDAISRAMSLRTPTPRELIQITDIPHKHGVWHQMTVLDDTGIT